MLPGNLERDVATRVEPPADQAGGSVADVSPWWAVLLVSQVRYADAVEVVA